MDAVQFGRWIGERRRACGWRSQRTLVEETRHEPFFRDCGISEDFLARLDLVIWPIHFVVLSDSVS